MDFQTENNIESCTHGRRTPRQAPATTSIRLDSCRPRGPMLHVLGTNDLHRINEAAPHSDDGTRYQQTRTVSHDDIFEKYLIKTMGKYNDGS